MQNTQTGLMHFLAQTDAVGMFVFVLLLLMSVASWTVIVVKAWRYARGRQQSLRVMQGFWEASSFQQAIGQLGESGRDDPFGALARSAERAWIHHHQRQAQKTLGESIDFSEFVTRQLRNAIGRATARLEWGQTLLASVGSTAPFVGLFGTVWGIYHALVSIAQTGQATLDRVAGPVGEALIMTGLGLAVAIPAVLAYNAFTRRNRVTLTDLDGFAHDLHAWLLTGARIAADGDEGAAARTPVEPAVRGA
jgi:biopolymer transport protein ExbB